VARRADDPFDELAAGITALTGRPATAEDRNRFQTYLDLFLRWNRTHRMTALHSPAAIVRTLFLDSLLFLPLLPPRPASIVDIGAGAGIPGLPLRLVEPRLALTLVEARRKRVSFLRVVCRELGLNDVVVKEGRAEELIEEDPTLAGSFDAVVSRAVGPVRLLVPVALRYLKPGGVFLASGPPKPRPGGPPGNLMEVVQVSNPGARGSRVFLRARKDSNVPRGT
jgi:16S rRNA (guanine527-N7)-methyltransferase